MEAPQSAARSRKEPRLIQGLEQHTVPILPHAIVEEHIRLANASFRGDYALLPTYESPCIDAGSLTAGSWLANALTELARLAEMGDNWDGYGAPAIHPAVVVGALMFLRSTAVRGMAAPAIVATGRGNVQLEWHRDGVEIDVEISSDGRYEASYSGPLGEHEATGSVLSVEPVVARAIAALEQEPRHLTRS